jgi:hypothetical protein
MATFSVWVRLNPYQTTHVLIQANHGYDAKLIAEAQYGQGNVLNYIEVNQSKND